MGLCIRIWDNLLVFGTRYIFQVSIAVLRLTQHDLINLDISDVNDYFKSFKDDDSGKSSKLLPSFETIISESYKVKINEEWLDELKVQYKMLQSPKKEKKERKIVGLAKIR